MGILSQTKLATVLDAYLLCELTLIGEIVNLLEREPLFRRGGCADYLYILVEGDLFLGERNCLETADWLGPGDAVGIEPFLLHEPYPRDAWTVEGCTLWRLPRAFVKNPGSHVAVLAHLLIALSPHMQARLREFRKPAIDLDELRVNHCDVDHPTIQETAALLKGRNPWETALNTWRFIQPMPYRFGLWDFHASEILQRGYGMCTTKAILHTALLRANGLEAGFANMRVPSHFVASLLPPGYRLHVSDRIKHFFTAVKLDGQWYPTDASFTDESLVVMARELPEVARFIGRRQERREPFSLVAESMGQNPYDFDLIPSLGRIMGKRPFFASRNLDAMNMLLDQEQGPVYRLPLWARQAQRLTRTNPRLAFQTAFAGAVGEAHTVCSAYFPVSDLPVSDFPVSEAGPQAAPVWA